MPSRPRSSARAGERRVPRQERSRATVEATLDAVVHLLRRGGAAAVTTNRIAKVAGVSVGSVYQYFPDKRAIFRALHERHVEQVSQLVERTLIQYAAFPLEQLIQALIGTLVESHAAEPELYKLLDAEVTHAATSNTAFQAHLQNALRLAITSKGFVSKELESVLFIVTHMVEALSHAAALRRPAHVPLAVAQREAARAVLAYLAASG
jgi:AcrR family transcriptional regulator